MERPPLLSSHHCRCAGKFSCLVKQSECCLGVFSRRHLAMDLDGRLRKLCTTRDFAKIILSQPLLFTGEKRREGLKVDGKLVAESGTKARTPVFNFLPSFCNQRGEWFPVFT